MIMTLAMLVAPGMDVFAKLLTAIGLAGAGDIGALP